MKIGILTFQFADNYGAVLQAYALKKSLSEKSNTTVEIINYANNRLADGYSISPFKTNTHDPMTFVKSCVKFVLKYKQRKKFNDFRKEALGITGAVQNKLHEEEYDVIVVGSDQVWNTDITFNDSTYFLQDVSGKVRKYSYAASAKNDFMQNVADEPYRLELQNFQKISVREIQLQKILEEKLGRKIELVCDPVFLQTREFWEQEVVMPHGINKDYILFYALRRNTKLEAIARKLSEEQGIPILVVHPTVQKITSVGKILRNIGPREFIGLVRNSNFVVSNSFHAFAYSCIFSKKLYFDLLPETSNRIQSLIQTLDIDVVNDSIGQYVDLKVYNTRQYKAMRNLSEDFIADILNNGENDGIID